MKLWNHERAESEGVRVAFETSMLRRSAVAEFASEIASPRALFFWPAGHTSRRAEPTTDVPGSWCVRRASVNALGRRFEVEAALTPPGSTSLWNDTHAESRTGPWT